MEGIAAAEVVGELVVGEMLDRMPERGAVAQPRGKRSALEVEKNLVSAVAAFRGVLVARPGATQMQSPGSTVVSMPLASR